MGTRALSPLHGPYRARSTSHQGGQAEDHEKAPKLRVQAEKWKEDIINATGKALSVLQSMGVPGTSLKPKCVPSRVYFTGGGDDRARASLIIESSGTQTKASASC